MNRSDRRGETPRLAPKVSTIEASWDVTNPNLDRISQDRSELATPGGATTRMSIATPLILRSDSILRQLGFDRVANDAQSKFAILARLEGGAILANVDDLANVAPPDLPFRIAPVEGHSLPTLDELTTANAIELQLGDWTQANVAESTTSLRSLKLVWPWDVPDLTRLAKKLSLLRELSQGQIPIGIAIPIADASEEGIAGLEWLVDVGVEFVTFRSAPACLGIHHAALKYFQCDPIQLTQRIVDLFDRHGNNSMMVAIDFPWSDGYHAAECILAGASLIVADGYLASTMATASKASSWSRNLHSFEWDRLLESFTQQLRASLELAS